ncbi:hypothetical protein ABPG74_004667 [Tetrahymena malaccensis]
MQKQSFSIKDVTFFCNKQKQYINMSNPQYLKITEVQYYFTEMTKLFLRKQGITATNLIADFSGQYIKGEHVLLKSNSHIQAIPMNKICFLVNLGRVFNLTEERLGYDFLQFLRLLCSDFPKLVVLKSLKMIKGDWHSDDDSILSMQYNGQTFIQSLFVNFLYEDLLNFLEEQTLQDCTVENVGNQILQYYEQQESQSDSITRPPLNILFQVLVQSADWQEREFTTNLVFFSENLMKDLVKGNKNKLSINEFRKKLFENKSMQKLVNENINFVDKSNAKVKEIIRIISEKPEDLFPPEEQIAKKKSKKKKE